MMFHDGVKIDQLVKLKKIGSPYYINIMLVFIFSWHPGKKRPLCMGQKFKWL